MSCSGRYFFEKMMNLQESNNIFKSRPIFFIVGIQKGSDKNIIRKSIITILTDKKYLAYKFFTVKNQGILGVSRKNVNINEKDYFHVHSNFYGLEPEAIKFDFSNHAGKDPYRQK